jgi:phage anti-repressor protein
MTEQLDIVKLIEENPITKLTNVYQSKLINKIKNRFSTEEQKLFVASFYCYLNYKKEDFVIDLNGIWKWLGFSSKHKAKELLLKYFTIEINYKILLNLSGEQVKTNGGAGLNKEQILMTINTFKRFCMRASTKKAVQIHEYFINLEETLHEVLDEETNELRLQLDNKQYGAFAPQRRSICIK